MINLIWAMTKTGVIGNKGQLPWKIAAEMQYFHTLTKNKTVLMGAKTFMSIKKPLVNRTNIIISHNPEKYQTYQSKSCLVTSDLITILKKYHSQKTNELWVIGGSQIYQQAWKYADYLYVSIIHDEYPGDSYFPYRDFHDFNLIKTWTTTSFTAYVYERNRKE